MPISDQELEHIRRKQREFLDALLVAKWITPRRVLGESDALEIGRKIGLKPILVFEFLHYWVGSGDLDPSWVPIATKIQQSLGATAYEQVETGFPPNETEADKRDKVFISYSRKDHNAFQQLKTMLAPLTRSGTLEAWDDTMIAVGANWKDEISSELRTAKVAVLLVSQNFLASDFIAKHELPPLLKAAEDEGVTVFWIYLSPCLYEHTEIARYQAAHDTGTALSQLRKPRRDLVLSQICTKLVQVVQRSTQADLSGFQDGASIRPDSIAITDRPGQARSPSAPNGQSKTTGATTPTFSGGVEFETDCIVNAASISALLQRTPPPAAPSLAWHPSVRTELERLDDWWDHFEVRSKVIPWAENDPLQRRNILSGMRAELRKIRERVHERLTYFPQALGRALIQTTGFDADLRVQAIRNLTGFMALQLIRLLRIGNRNLPDPGPREHLSFPTLPDVPDWLVELVPSRSVLGSYVFYEDSFLKARVGARENSYESIVMPRVQAEYLHKSERSGDLPTFLRWVLPQWLLYGHETVITPEDWRVWVLTDDLNRECYMSFDKRPWA